VTAKLAIEALRHVVQDHGDQDTEIGKPGDAEMAKWIGKILGMTMPPSYLQILAQRNGLDDRLFDLMYSMELYAIYRDRWGAPVDFWPVAGDGCGNYICACEQPQGPGRRIADRLPRHDTECRGARLLGGVQLRPLRVLSHDSALR